MSDPHWQILIATVVAREQQFASLLDCLLPQLAQYQGAVEVLVYTDDCDLPVGVKRTRLLEQATGDYVNFLDDDDRVSPDYVERICDAISTGPDQVGFEVAYLHDGMATKRTYHSLRHKGWSEDAHGYYRDFSHLNPLRREIAMVGLPFLDGFGEDGAWAAKVRASGLAVKETYIPEVLYTYLYSTSGSLFAGGPRRTGREPARVAHPYVSYVDAP